MCIHVSLSSSSLLCLAHQTEALLAANSTSCFRVCPNKTWLQLFRVCIGNRSEDLVNSHGKHNIQQNHHLTPNSIPIAEFQAHSNIKTQTDWFPFMWIYCNCRKRNFNKSLEVNIYNILYKNNLESSQTTWKVYIQLTWLKNIHIHNKRENATPV